MGDTSSWIVLNNSAEFACRKNFALLGVIDPVDIQAA